MTQSVKSCFYQSADGLKLHYRDYIPDADRVGTPAVCLPGLGRTVDDFERLALALCRSPTPRRVIAIDYRGRGLSEHDRDWRNYSLEIERGDILRALAQARIGNAHLIGTSRGGLHILGLCAEHRAVIRGAVFNDIGPVLERDGLARIKSYIGKPVHLRSIEEAVALLKVSNGRFFDGLSSEEWRTYAKTTFGTDPSRLGLRYDPAIARTLDAFDLDKPLPDSWDLFDRLKGAPVLTIRGANSDLLCAETLDAMRARWAASETMTVAGQGHAPLLADAATIARVERFLGAAD